MRILHIISCLDSGGAQQLLNEVAIRTKDDLDHSVISLSGSGFYTKILRDSNVEVMHLDLKSNILNIFKLFSYRISIRPDIVHGWMYHSNLIASIFFLGKPVLWSVHSANLLNEGTKQLTKVIARALAFSSGFFANSIVYCSNYAREMHEIFGFNKLKSKTIFNGIDTDSFCPSPLFRNQLRRELGLPDDAILIGYIARFHPLKNHDMFFRVAKKLISKRADIQLILCGIDISEDNVELMKLIEESGVSKSLHLLGQRGDIQKVTAALDVALSCSKNESFSLTTAEAMSCKVPVVITDIPGASAVLGEFGAKVALDDDETMVNSCLEILEMPDHEKDVITNRARDRVISNFSLDRMVKEYVDLYKSLGS